MIELRGGLIVADDAVDLALRLERAGHLLTSKDGVLIVSNGTALAADDRDAVRTWKRHLLAIAGYDADAVAVEVPSPLVAGVRPGLAIIGNSADTVVGAKETAAVPHVSKPKPRKRAAAVGAGLFDA